MTFREWLSQEIPRRKEGGDAAFKRGDMVLASRLWDREADARTALRLLDEWANENS